MQKRRSDILESYVGGIPQERIRKRKFPRPSRQVIDEFLELEDMTCTVSSVLDSLQITGAIPASILQPIVPGKKIAGPAVTLRNIPSRTDVSGSQGSRASAKLAAFDIYRLARPGDVIVIDAGGRFDVSNMGRLAALAASRRGIAGSVVDGGVRDVAGIRELMHGVWARGVTPKSMIFRTESAEINGQIQCAGVQVSPGDLILADDSGVAVVPSDRVEEVLTRAKEKADSDSQVAEAVCSEFSQ
jgi:4-hydroxy-4-methyl-2-oxoglutarate aldolase